MELKAVSAPEVVELVFGRSGLSSSTNLLSVESLAFLLRRAASLICPVAPRGLVSAVVDPLQPLVPDREDLRERCKEVLEELICYGDLIESDDVSRLSENRLLYRTPPSFVRVSEVTYLVVGVAPDGIDPIPVELSPRYKGVLRILDKTDHSAVDSLLRHAGLHELSYSAWAKPPYTKPYSELLEEFDLCLNQASPSDVIEELQVLNTAIRNTSYRQQWVDSKDLTGRYIGRRPRRYGADLWCYVELVDGTPQRLVDLPLGRTTERACDQAWRLQCALDADHRAPQQYRLDEENGNIRITIHLPCPAWLVRRWECIGKRTNNSVFTFEFALADGLREANLLETELWMVQEERAQN